MESGRVGTSAELLLNGQPQSSGQDSATRSLGLCPSQAVFPLTAWTCGSHGGHSEVAYFNDQKSLVPTGGWLSQPLPRTSAPPGPAAGWTGHSHAVAEHLLSQTSLQVFPPSGPTCRGFLIKCAASTRRDMVLYFKLTHF